MTNASTSLMLPSSARNSKLLQPRKGGTDGSTARRTSSASCSCGNADSCTACQRSVATAAVIGYFETLAIRGWLWAASFVLEETVARYSSQCLFDAPVTL